MSFDFSAENLDREFPVRRNLVYLNHAAAAPLPRRVADAIIAHVENARDRGVADWRRAYGDVEKARAKTARFIGAAPEEIAFLPNTSWAVNLVALGFPWRAGDNVVTDDMEFPSNAYPGARSSAAVSTAAWPSATAAASRSIRSRPSSTRARASSPSPGSPSTTASSSR